MNEPIKRHALSLLQYRSEADVDRVLGARKPSPPTSHKAVDWSQCPLAQRYPQWEDYWAALAQERVDAKREGRALHPAAAPPLPQRTADIPPDPGPEPRSAGAVKKDFPNANSLTRHPLAAK